MCKHWWVVAAALALAACSGSTDSPGGGGSCAWNGACGGDNVGTWSLQSECIVGTPSPPASCPKETIHLSPQVSGTLDYGADGTYTSNVTAVVTESFNMPASCHTGTDCASIETDLKSTTGITSASCTGSASTACSCTFTESLSVPSSGTWTASGGTITVDFGSGNTVGQNYCVQGNTLTMRGTPSGGIQTQLVAVRQ